MRAIAAVLALSVAFALFVTAAIAWNKDSSWLAATVKQEDTDRAAAENRDAERAADSIRVQAVQKELENDQIHLNIDQVNENIARLENRRPNYRATEVDEQRIRADKQFLDAAQFQSEFSMLSQHPALTGVRASGEIERRRDRRLVITGVGVAFLVGGLALFPRPTTPRVA
jgi:flagellar motility protein MotE (MotC chaperone)